MPDLIYVLTKRWKLVTSITLITVIVALIVALLSPKKYLGVATALPANSMIADKARIFNQNIRELYSDFGTVDELDKLEGTGKLDTLFLAAAETFSLDEHYKIGSSAESLYDAALKLKRNSKIARSGYGELKVKVWDTNKNLCAQLANFLMKKIEEIHQHLQNESNILVLAKIKEAFIQKQKEFNQVSDSSISPSPVIDKAKLALVTEQLQMYEKMIDEYQLAIATNAPVLLVVENARPALWPDRPRILQIALLSFFGAFIFSFFIAVFIESKKPLV